MKKIYTLLLIFAVTFATAQNKDTKKADQLYDKLAYTDAAAAYQKLLKQGKAGRYVFERLADCYYYTNDTKKAETYYKRVAKGRKVKPNAVYNYAQVLKANGKLSEYGTWMKKFSEMSPTDSRAKEFLNNPNEVPQIIADFALFEAKPLEDLNTEYSEFGGFVHGKDFYFSSARNTTRKKYHWDEQPFLDVYKAQLVGDAIKNASLVEGDVNTKYHEGNVTITKDGKRMYFDRNDYLDGDYDKSSEGINQINLYYTELVDGNWKGVYEVPFNNDEYSTGHPALSADGSTLYFVSDMPGGKGDSDIYMVSIDKSGSFGTPAAVGGNINTEGKEVFPYSDSLGNLYFSSNGHAGLGGLDGFLAEKSRSGFKDVVNLGKGANSEGDDFAFIYEAANKTGFMSSNRKGGKGEDDMYILNAIDPPCDVLMDVMVINEYTDEPIFGARLDLYDGDTKVSTKSTAENGKNTLTGECQKPLKVNAYMTGFEGNSVDVAASPNGTITKTIKLRPIETIIVDDKIDLNPILFDYNKADIKSQAAFELDRLVTVMKKYPKMVVKVESHSDTRGKAKYNRELSDRRAKSTVAYVISQGIDAARISGQGYGLDKPAVDCGSKCTDADHQKNRRSEFIIVSR